MKYLLLLTFGFAIFQANKISAQNLSSHQWKDRLLLIKTKDTNNLIYQKQIKKLKEHLAGLAERKLSIYHIQKDKYKKGLLSKGAWNKLEAKSRNLEILNADFEVILIGLDGQIKLKQTDFLSVEQLFSKIDTMPMRRYEMSKQ